MSTAPRFRLGPVGVLLQALNIPKLLEMVRDRLLKSEDPIEPLPSQLLTVVLHD